MSNPDTDRTADDSADAPTVKDHAGPWDELVNRAILLALPVGIAAIGVWLAVTGQVRVDYTITGDVPAALVFSRLVVPAAYAIGAVLLALYVLALMKFYGSNPVVWLAERVRNAAADYNPADRD